MPTPADLDAFRAAVSKELLRRWYIPWDEAGADDTPLLTAMECGETPEEFVAWFAEKYGLIEFDGPFGEHAWTGSRAITPSKPRGAPEPRPEPATPKVRRKKRG